MTLKQLRYVAAVAEIGNITGAAKALFITQPSLTMAIHELEEEYGITIFVRSNKGIELTPDGEEFLGYARQVLEQTELLDDHYTKNVRKQRFCVSGQHYSFAVEAFVRLLKDCDFKKYEFHMRETKTYDLIDDVANLRSDIGILYMNKFNETVIKKTLKDRDLVFYPLFRAKPHVFVSKRSPLASKKSLTLEDLKPYPRLSYEQGGHNSFYFSEEILSTVDCDKEIQVLDRASLFNMLRGLDGYTICSGVISSELNGEDILAIPLMVDDYMELGYILPRGVHVGALTLRYIEMLKKSCESSL